VRSRGRRAASSCPTVLLIEDHEDVREMYRVTLEAAGYTVIADTTPANALERVRGSKIDLVIMDIGLDGEGLKVAEDLTVLPAAPRLVAVTGRHRQVVPAEDLFVEYLLKPVLPESLVEVVRRVLSRR
jgi:two-component system catabolic regulation response regulator CreB